jgi:hypothetical protein
MKRVLRVYAIADVHSPDAFEMPKLDSESFDVVLTLGDIDEATLDYICHMSQRIPKYGVPGGHDKRHLRGVEDLHRKVVIVNGIRIAGFGGAPKYKSQLFHYSERQVAVGMIRMPPADILITHTPPRATSMQEDRIHKGFRAFDRYIRFYSPSFMLHGHLERNSKSKVDQTLVYGVACRRPIKLTFDKEYYPSDNLQPRKIRFFSSLFWMSAYLKQIIMDKKHSADHPSTRSTS